MEVSTQMIITLVLIALTLYAFVKEITSPDLIALSVLCMVVILGLVGPKEILTVFSSDAPLAIGSLFVIGTALEKTGGVLQISALIQRVSVQGLRPTLILFCTFSAFFSAFMNNTAIVAIMLPVTLSLARSKNISASKLLIPLSYASIFGGCCTLIGTSTNLTVNSKLSDYGLEKLQMFELAWIGIPLSMIGILYLVILGPKLLPDRTSVTGMLDAKQRSTPLFHILVEKESPLVGLAILDTPFFDPKSGIHLLEVRRNGERLMLPISQIVIQANDRFLIGVHGRRNKAAGAEELLPGLHVTTLSKIEGIVTELVITEESELCQRTLAQADFRQRYNAVVLAVHRNGNNITKKLATTELDHGDTLLVLTAQNNLLSLAASHNFVLTDAAVTSPAPGWRSKATLTWVILFGVVLSVTIFREAVPMHMAALTGAVLILWLKLISTREAYAGVDWAIIFTLYGMFALGEAMESTGTAKWLAEIMLDGLRMVTPDSMLKLACLSCLIFGTIFLTEILSNNATALMMLPIVVNLAKSLECSPTPFVVGICIGASAAFMLPMGYQTHMMVYGPGGYKFSDFIRIGLPLNIIVWILASLIIPMVWSF